MGLIYLVSPIVSIGFVFCVITIFLFNMCSVKVKFSKPENLKANDSYIVISNHLSFCDTMLIQYFCLGLPSPVFIIKDYIKYFPFFGWINYLARFPKVKSLMGAKKLEHEIHTSCSYYVQRPCTYAVFVEGTRFTSHRKKKLRDNYKYLLSPHPKAVALVAKSLVSRSLNY